MTLLSTSLPAAGLDVLLRCLQPLQPIYTAGIHTGLLELL